MADEKKEKSLDDIAGHFTDSEHHRVALDWLSKIEGWAKEWKVVRDGGQANPEVVKGIPRTEFHEVKSFGALYETKIDLIAAFNRARELAEERGESEKMDVYVNLTIADEVLTRLKDGRLILADMHPTRGPILAVTRSGPTEEEKNKEK